MLVDATTHKSQQVFDFFAKVQSESPGACCEPQFFPEQLSANLVSARVTNYMQRDPASLSVLVLQPPSREKYAQAMTAPPRSLPSYFGRF
jgi:hypothetical protein